MQIHFSRMETIFVYTLVYFCYNLSINSSDSFTATTITIIFLKGSVKINFVNSKYLLTYISQKI
jgi:hypothetical protein